MIQTGYIEGKMNRCGAVTHQADGIMRMDSGLEMGDIIKRETLLRATRNMKMWRTMITYVQKEHSV